jgi:hypothetical protein
VAHQVLNGDQGNADVVDGYTKRSRPHAERFEALREIADEFMLLLEYWLRKAQEDGNLGGALLRL